MNGPEIITLSRVIDAYLDSQKFLKLAGSSQKQYERYLHRVMRSSLGSMPVEQIKPKHVMAFLDAMASQPDAQKSAFVAIKAVERWGAGPRDLLPYPITTGIEVAGGDGGHKPWTDAQIATAIEHARPDLARAILLAANTGQRISDLVRMAWTDLEEIEGRLGINVIQKKTGLQLWIPFTQQLTAAVAAWERRPAPLLLRQDGARWKRSDLAMAWGRQREVNPKLEACRGLVFHGLRASACVRLKRLGATTLQISDMVGLSEKMVIRYCRFSVQRENAMAAVHFLDGTPRERTAGYVTTKQSNS